MLDVQHVRICSRENFLGVRGTADPAGPIGRLIPGKKTDWAGPNTLSATISIPTAYHARVDAGQRTPGNC